MFSYFVVVSYPHWFKFCQKCDIKFRIHNYHFFHKQNPIVLSNFLWKNHLWSMDCQRGDAFLEVNLGSVPLCITSWSILSFSCGYILMFPMKMRRKEWTECQHTRRIWHDDPTTRKANRHEWGIFLMKKKMSIRTGFRKRMALM